MALGSASARYQLRNEANALALAGKKRTHWQDERITDGPTVSPNEANAQTLAGKNEPIGKM